MTTTDDQLRPYFAFEEKIWSRRDDARLQLCRFERVFDEPVLSPGPKGSPDDHRIEWTNVVRTNGRFTMWYTGMRPPPQDVWHMEDRQNTCVAFSDDGLRWEKPDLKLSGKSWGGAPDNVLPKVSYDVYGTGVIHDGDRYIMMHVHPRGLKKREGQTTFSIYTSRDGLRWKGNRRPCTEVQHFEPACSLFIFKGKYWVLGQGVSPFYHMPDGRACGRVMFAYSSDDLRTWRRSPDPAYAYPIPKHFPESAVQNHVGAAVVDRGRIGIGFMGQFWPAGFSEVVGSTFGLIYSYDAAHWTEPFPGEPLLMPREGAWDCGMLLQGSGFYSQGETSYYWYSGLDGGNLWWPRGSAGVCRIRRDGFAYFSPAPERQCLLQTAPIALAKQDQKLYLNASASTQSPVDVTCLDAGTGKPLAQAKLSRGGVLVPVLDLPCQHGQSVSLRFKLYGRAKLYGFYIGRAIEPKQYLAQWS